MNALPAVGFEFTAALWLLPLALLPLLPRWGAAGAVLHHTWAAQLPRDRASELLNALLRGTTALTIAATVLAIAGPYRPEDTVERVGRGAEIVLLLDRSRSMDEKFAGGRPSANAPKGTGPEALDYYMKLRDSGTRDSKGKVARQMLGEFAAQRPEDRFGMLVFSTLPIRVLEFTQKADVIQAAIAAGDVGRGLADTDIGVALLAALASFEDRAYTGSRIVLLVSDGGDHLDVDTRERITHLARKHRVALYWLYIRANTSPGLMLSASEAPANTDTVPEYFLHRFFQQLGTPYRAFEAENPEALKKAIAEVSRLENLPIIYRDVVPRRDLSAWCLGAALAAVLALLVASRWEIKTWA